MQFNTKLVIIVTAVIILVGGIFLISGSGGNGVVGDEGQTQEKVEQKSNYPSNYLDFSSGEYEKAREEGKVVMLYFMANWCPTCKAQEPVNLEAFRELEKDDDIIVLKIHILDSETTDETEQLAEEYGVRIQNTFVIINSGSEVVFTHTGPLVKEDLVKNLLGAKS
jgi:thiol:disulfide interchange protein